MGGERACRRGMAALLAAGMLLAGGCGSTFQTGKAAPSGFLGDYSQLRAGGAGEAQLRYVNSRIDFSRYRAIVMDPIRMHVAEDSTLQDIPADDRQRIVNYLHATVVEALTPDYTFVDAPAAHAMRLRIAITEARGSKVVMDTVSSLIPIGMALGLVKKVATGTNMSVGEAGIELELLDSLSNERLLALVDERAGRKYTGKFDKFDRYHTVDDAFDHWAVDLRQQLAALRGR